MNILLADMHKGIEAALVAMGHRVENLRLGGGVFSLPGIISRLEAEKCFRPDVFIQMEFLGPRRFFTRLEETPCPTVFWAIDTHLGMFWHKWYAQLFDMVLSPHKSLFDELPALLRPAVFHPFSWPGECRPQVAHADRRYDLGLCARVDGNRKIRLWMVELLSSQGIEMRDGLSYNEMMAFYGDTRVVPNECIANEVNFRLLEAASAGALVLSPDVGEDQNRLLSPGTEFLVYRDGVELLEHVLWARKHPRIAEAIGRSAQDRVLREHLAKHRAAELMERVGTASQHRATGITAQYAMWLTLAVHIRNKTLNLDPIAHAKEGLRLAATCPKGNADAPANMTGERAYATGRSGTADVATMNMTDQTGFFGAEALIQALALFAECGAGQQAEATDKGLDKEQRAIGMGHAFGICRELLALSGMQGNITPHVSFDPGAHPLRILPGAKPDDVSGGSIALPRYGYGDSVDSPTGKGQISPFAQYAPLYAAATAFALREGNTALARALYTAGGGQSKEGAFCDTPAYRMGTYWAEMLRNKGQIFQAGFTLLPEQGMLPGSALEWLVFLRFLEPETIPALAPHFDILLSNRPNMLSLAVGFLAEHTFMDQQNWRVQQEYALVCLQANRVEEGLYELGEALKKAREQRRERLFWGRLAATRPEGRNWKQLLMAE